MVLSAAAVEFKLFEAAKKGLVNGNTAMSPDTVNNLRQDVLSVQSSPAFNINQHDEDGRAVIHWACASGNEEMVDLLLEFKADAAMKDDAGWTPLHLASSTGQSLIVEKLALRKLCDVNEKNSSGAAALHYAASKGFDETVQILLNAGADPNILDKAGSTALHRAASKGHVNVGKLLLSAGADIETQDREGYTPMHLACMEANLQISLLLLRKGANLNPKAKDGKTPLDFVPKNHQHVLLNPPAEE